MKIKHIFPSPVFVTLLLAVTILTACNVNGPGIFYTVYNEVKISESLISDKPVYKVLSAGGTIYTLAGAAVYKQEGATWTKIDPPSDGMRAVSLAQLGGTTVYAVYETESSGSISDTMYQLSGATWNKIPAASTIDDSLNLSILTVDNDDSIFFINRRTGVGTYAVYSFNGSLNTLSLTDITKPVMSAAINIGTYFLAASNTTGSSVLYSTNGTTNFLVVTTSGFDTGKTVGGITENSAKDTLYLSTGDSFLYKSTDGTAWTAVNTTALTDSYSNAASLGDMAVVSYNTTNYLIIAADNGYFEMDLSGNSPALPSITAVNFETYELSQEAVFSLYAENDKIYMGSDTGLWLSKYGSSGPDLDRE